MTKKEKRFSFQEPPRLSESAKWFCAITNPNCQRRAELELYALGFRTFTPKLRKWVSHARIKKAVERPILGRYLFVELDPNDEEGFYAVRAVNGVEGFVAGSIVTRHGLQMQPIQMPSEQVESLRVRQMSGEWDFVRKDQLPIGAQIAIVEGEFEDMLAVITGRKRGKLEVRVLRDRDGLPVKNTVTRIYEHSARAA